jgi:hypothetical protein
MKKTRSHEGRFEFFRKFTEIFAAKGLPPVSTTPVANAKNANLPPVSTTQGKMVAKFATGVVDTGGKFAAGVVDTGGKFATGVVDTNGAPWLANKFRKNSNRS